MLKFIQFGLIGILILAIFATLNFARETPGVYTAQEMMSPKDRVSESQIKVFDDKVIIEVEKPTWAAFTNTNSMDPFLDFGANSIEIMPDGPNDIRIGDVISYYLGGSLIVHRVIEVGKDEEGVFYMVKGDNNSEIDPSKVRYSQVHGVLVAVIY